MSDINLIIYEDISNLNEYKPLNKLINQANRSYKNALIAHNNNDSVSFMDNMKQHRNFEIGIHRLLSNPSYLSNGKDYVQQRRNLSSRYLSTLSPIE